MLYLGGTDPIPEINFHDRAFPIKFQHNSLANIARQLKGHCTQGSHNNPYLINVTKYNFPKFSTKDKQQLTASDQLTIMTQWVFCNTTDKKNNDFTLGPFLKLSELITSIFINYASWASNPWLPVKNLVAFHGTLYTVCSK